MNKKEEKIRKILEKYSDDAWYDGRIWDGVDDGIIRAMLEFGEECFEAGREFNSKDGIVDIDVVIFYKGADNSDLEPLYPLYEDYLNNL